MLATEEGWSVPRWGVPSSWPAQRMVCGPHGLHLVWVLYDDLGGVRTVDEATARRLMTGDGTVF
ncbi:hypothetical protein [Cryobacterium sp. GrIS_2_6]|uniref:hypothetical protein n=1 Tax=Cryobacterium sp. GrIS_2_6 TaxID=3162785 RepID=UPI002DFD0CEE|nr:hypothetical protein [Cryobacterium psychrotolerans]MEC5149346.1 hypothetical protein [Cryobacterium psychrotolerans]